MAAPRSSTLSQKPVSAASQATQPGAPAKQPAARKPARVRATDNGLAADILRQIKIDGEALSAQIERLRHRFL